MARTQQRAAEAARQPLSPESARRFGAVVLPHLDAAFNLARHLMRNADDAEDAVQEACLRAMRYFEGFRGGDGRAWLLSIVRNTCFTELRRRRASAATTEFDEEIPGVPEGEPAPEADLVRRATAASLQQALEELPLVFREVIVLRELEDFSYKEIAQVAGVPIGTVRSRLARARAQLQRALQDVAGSRSSR